MFRLTYYRITGWILAFFTLMAVVSSVAATTGSETEESFRIEGVPFSRTYAEGGLSLTLHNAALLRYKILFRGYVVGFYLPEDTDPAAALSEVPKRLEFYESDYRRIVEQPGRGGLRQQADPAGPAAMAVTRKTEP